MYFSIYIVNNWSNVPFSFTYLRYQEKYLHKFYLSLVCMIIVHIRSKVITFYRLSKPMIVFNTIINGIKVLTNLDKVHE